MKSREEILDRLAQIQRWKEMADRQHAALIQEIDRLRVMGGRSTNDNDVAKQWNEEYRQQCSKIESLQVITIPGFCANQNIVGINSLLEGMLAALAWTLEGE